MLFKQDSQKVSRCDCCAQDTAWNDEVLRQLSSLLPELSLMQDTLPEG